MKVAVCCIAKLENDYIREWVKHYKSINVDNVIIYDNNDIDGENISDVIREYLNNGFAIVEECKGKQAFQCMAYYDCLIKYREQYDWIAFFDADEFLDVKDIKDFLSNESFNNFKCVRVPWRVFDDSNIVETNGDYSVKRFTHFRDCRQCKAIVNTRTFKNIRSLSPHGPLFVKACDPNGEPCPSNSEFICNSIKEKKYDVWLNHYMLKTLEEYITHKMNRLYPDQGKQSASRILTPERFFMLNEITQEKLDWLKKNNIPLNIKDGKLIYIRDKSFYDAWFQ